ncbi:MAG: F0F1 ATP synthase subunit A [Clostridiales bacterium]|jgi:F-type H+-transporting ATPase subunit a|nr:F0F1 ATP synthase subunit A [Clostridiales bacterium]MDY4654813.1 FoF1 ATP synthase subunit a [Eubacteriales bacterium]
MLGVLLAANDVNEKLTETLSPEKVSLFGTSVMVNPSFYTALAVSAILIVAAIILRFTVVNKMKDVPGKVQTILEMFVGGFSKMAEGKYSGFVGGYIAIAAIYIGLGTLVELLGFRPVMADLNACVAMGVSTFGLIFFYGFKANGKNRLKHFLNPINIVTDLAVPVSLSFRLFGSIMSGLLITELVYSFLFTSFVVPVIVSVITTLFHAFIQAYIFATLSTLFIAEATE